MSRVAKLEDGMYGCHRLKPVVVVDMVMFMVTGTAIKTCLSNHHNQHDCQSRTRQYRHQQVPQVPYIKAQCVRFNICHQQQNSILEKDVLGRS
ncbi:MAG: hypothetical protein ACLFSQ_07720 [Candidatus Zixiibacteriota bacterium]